jgi:spermidine synthase
MPETLDPAQHVRPFVYETLTRKALHFSICEVQSRMDLRDPYALDLEYTRTMMAFLLFAPAPRHITMIGLGGGSLAKFCHRHLPHARIDVVEINPHVIALRDDFHVPPDDARFRVIAGNGARYVRGGATRCDTLMVDGFDSDGQPGGLCSQRFYDDACDMLQPGGMLVVNLHSGHRDHARHLERIRRSFAGAMLVVDDGGLGNSIVFACKGPALERFRPGVVRPPKGLSKDAAKPLLAAFALVSSAWKEQFG